MPTPATVFLSETNGAGATVTDNISNVNFGGVDTPNLIPANHPVVRPSGGVAAFSFNKMLRLKVDSMGDSLLINNTKTWKTSGAYVTGEVIGFRSNLAYAQPIQTNAGGGTYPIVEPAPNIYVGGVAGGNISAAPTYTNYFDLQLFINSGGVTPIGAVNQKIFIFQWDES